MWAVSRNLSIVTCSSRLCKSFNIAQTFTQYIWLCRASSPEADVYNTYMYCFDQCRTRDDRFSAQNLKYFGDQFLLCYKDSLEA